MAGDYIDDRLHAWARWLISGRPNLGLSDRTLLYEMVRSGIIAKGFGLKPEPDSTEEEQTEAAMQQMRQTRPDEHYAVCMHYLAKGQPKQKAKDMGITESRYFKLVKVGKYYLEGYFDRITTNNGISA